MYRQMIPRSFLWLVNTVAILAIGITGAAAVSLTLIIMSGSVPGP